MSQFLSQPRVLLPNTLNATPRAVGDLHLWASGDPLQAADLNANFLYVLSLIGGVRTLAAEPDAGGLEAMEFGLELDRKIATIERHLGEEAKRQPRQAAPLAVLAALKKQIDSIEGPLRQHGRGLQELLMREQAEHSNQGERLQRLEHRPAPPTVEEVQRLQQALARLAGEAQEMRYQLMTAQREIERLRPMAQEQQESHAQRVLRSDYAIGQIEQLWRRAEALERPHEEVKEAQAEVAAMRQEVQALRQEMQQAAERQRNDNLRLHAALLERIEGLEKKHGTEEGRPG